MQVSNELLNRHKGCYMCLCYVHNVHVSLQTFLYVDIAAKLYDVINIFDGFMIP